MCDEMKRKDKIYKMIDNHNIISFDVFDTLICRDVNNYKDVFDLIEKKLIKEYGQIFVGFARKRIDAEKKARELVHREVTLDEIYENLDYSNKQCIKAIEQETEISITIPNMTIIPIYNYCVINKKTIIITSDMYLDESVIEKILKKNGFDNYSKIFVSSRYGAQKRNGKLFKKLVDEMNVNPKEILHIGDNYRSDVLFAKLNGIKGKGFKNKSEASYICSENKLYNFINNRIKKIDDVYEKIGYEVYGMLIVGFLDWCYSEINKKNIQKVFFAARDGYVLKKAFEILYPNYKSTYFKVSRRAVQVPTINFNNCGFDFFLKISSFDAISNSTSIYKRIGLEKFPLSTKDVYQSQLREFFEKDLFVTKNKNLIFSNAAEERIAMLQYLNEIDFNEKVAFIDVGWKCSTQNALSCFTDTDILGLYLGIHPKAKNEVCGKGYLFDREYSDYFYSVMGGMSIIEAFFTSPEKSLKKYKLGGYDKKVYFEYDTGEKLDINSNVFKMQKGAMEFVSDYGKSILHNLNVIDKDEAFSTLKSIIDNPKKEYIDVFGNILMENEGRVSPILKNSKTKGLKENIKGYGNSGWKIGYIKRMLKLPLFYKEIFKITYNCYKKK